MQMAGQQKPTKKTRKHFKQLFARKENYQSE